MTALFDKSLNLVGWLSDNREHIFDTEMNWVAFIASDSSVWSVSSKTWKGHLYGNNIRDTMGKTAFWNPDTPIQNSFKPLTPFVPFTPFAPFRPFKPFSPFTPFKPFDPMGGWSEMNWKQFI